MKIRIQYEKNQSDFELIYRKEDYSIDIEEKQNKGFTSVLINDLQLEIDDTGKIIYVWGLCPIINFEKTDESPHDYKAGSLYFLLSKPLTPGISLRLNEENRWPLYVNTKKSWICLGDPEMEGIMIEFSPNCIATIKENEVIAIWLHPKNLPFLSGA